ncbi:MAG: SDR family NAD(P)-dependent oxidoreductase, partial [Exilibacterium sp.]
DRQSETHVQMPPVSGGDFLLEMTAEYLKTHLAEVATLPPHRIDANAPLERYGIDSVMVMKLTRQLERVFGSLSKTLFFEYQTLAELSDYFAAGHRDILTRLLDAGESPSPQLKKSQTENAPDTRTDPVSDQASAKAQGWRRLNSPPAARDREHRLRGNSGPENRALGEMAPVKKGGPGQEGPGGASGADCPDIAIIGLAGRYPQAGDLEQFWANLKVGRDCITEIPPDRWDHSLYFDENYFDQSYSGETRDRTGKTYSKWGGFLDGVDEFDPLFFNISPREAEIMDPQERLFLQCAHATLEDAGYTRDSLARDHAFSDNPGRENPAEPSRSSAGASVGVFVGVMYEEHQLYGAQASVRGRPVALPGNPASIANRVSYHLNLHGPSMAVDSMCSSSLSTLHLACQSLQRGDCLAALAGGVNVSIHPNKYLLLAQGKFISSRGRCESFGDGGDGYVPGEGVGAALLKPLASAEADGDPIYAVIKATAVNHGGKTNGYTVPNPNAQAAVIDRAFARAGIDPRTIDYLEAHGTGTTLGDPIEITGLNKAFRRHTQERQFCAIGSVKSNIGHCESAAGIAALTKVLLQLRHGQLVPSLHAESLNPNIDFAASPFTVQRRLDAWPRWPDRPRRAGISSFGAGGANAHIIVEEYITGETTAGEYPGAGGETAFAGGLANGPKNKLFVLSAKNEERLKVLAANLRDHLAAHPPATDADLENIAYTLQVGREAMDERLAFRAGSPAELEEKLGLFLQPGEIAAGLYRGRIKGHRDTLALFADEDLRQAIATWIAKGKYEKLLDLWVKGLDVDWRGLYRDRHPQRISLPTYPFARNRYWIAASLNSAPVAAPVGGGARLHPLLHRNTSLLSRQRFSSLFTGEEFFLRDHRIGGEKVLPGVVYLEMARAAVEHSLELSAFDGEPSAFDGETSTFNEKPSALEKKPSAPGDVPSISHEGNSGRLGQSAVQLCDIVWSQPLIFDRGSREVHIGLTEEDRGEITFEIYTQEDSGAGPTIHSQGRVRAIPAARSPRLDREAIAAACDRHRFSAAQCYSAFSAMGIDYGPAHRGIEEILVGETQLLARLRLPAPESRDDFLLHPGLLDAALQASIGTLLAGAGPLDRGLPVPFALGALRILAPCPASPWVWVRGSGGDESLLSTFMGGQGGVQKLDIDLCDADGQVCVQFVGFSVRRIPGSAQARPAELTGPATELTGAAAELTGPEAERRITVALFRPGWRECPVIQPSLKSLDNPSLKRLPSASVRSLQSKPGPIEQQFQDCAEHLLELLQTQLKPNGKSGPGSAALIQVLVPATGEERLLAALAGLLKTASLENPRLSGQLIEIEATAESAGGVDPVADLLLENSLSPGDRHIRYRDGKRLLPAWREISAVTPAPAGPQAEGSPLSPWKHGGVYLITGGAGGLGLIIAAEIARRADGVRLVLSGRSPLDQRRREQLRALENPGTRIDYRRVDVADENAVRELIQNIEADGGRLDGVIHSAGVIRDGFILKKDRRDLPLVLAPKVRGVVNLDRATGHLDLDLFVVFSSVSGALGNVGQADYAAANAFLDHYAHYRNALVAEGRRRGKTLSLNWPLWKEGGMAVGAETESLLWEITGLAPLPTGAGIQALYLALASDSNQVLVLPGEVERLKRNLLAGVLAPESRAEATLENSVENPAIAGYSAESAENRAPVEAPAVAAKGAAMVGTDPVRLREKLQIRLIQAVCEALKVKPGDIDIEEELSAYGFDSVTLTAFTNQLNREYQLQLTPTVFFEYASIEAFAGYLMEEHRDALVAAIAPPLPPAEDSPARPSAEAGAPVAERGRRRRPVGRDANAAAFAVTGAREPSLLDETAPPATVHAREPVRLGETAAPATMRTQEQSRLGETAVRASNPVIPADTAARTRETPSLFPSGAVAVVGISGCFPGAEN